MNKILGKINVGSVIPPEYEGLARAWGLVVYSDLGILIAFLATSLFVAALFYIGLLISLGPLIEKKAISNRILIVMSAVLGIFGAYSGAPIITMLMHIIVGYFGSFVAGAIIFFILGGLVVATFYSARAAKREAETIAYEKGIELESKKITYEEKKREYSIKHNLIFSIGENVKVLLLDIYNKDNEIFSRAKEIHDKLNSALRWKDKNKTIAALLEAEAYLNSIKERSDLEDLKDSIRNIINDIKKHIKGEQLNEQK
ncbi:MAG: hypothetical protein QXV63_02580 [Candidatus Aenigmatarchaeota archaeon]